MEGLFKMEPCLEIGLETENNKSFHDPLRQKRLTRQRAFAKAVFREGQEGPSSDNNSSGK